MTYTIWGVIIAVVLLFSFWRLWENFGVKTGPSRWGIIDNILIMPIFICICVLTVVVMTLKIIFLLCTLQFTDVYEDLKDLKDLWK